MKLKHSAAMIFLVFVYVAVFTQFYTTDTGIITAGNDMNNIIPGSMALGNPELFTKDIFFQNFIDFYPKTFMYLHYFLTDLTGDFIVTNYLISSLCFLIFILGMYWLVYSQLKDTRIALVCALLCVAVRPALGVKFGISLGLAIPRYLLLALSPWIIWYFYHLIDGKQSFYKWGGLFFVLGLLGNVHPISAGLLTLVLLGILLMEKISIGDKAKQSIFALMSFGIGAFPFILDKLTFVGTGGIAPRSLILERAWFILPPYPRNFGNYGLFALQILPFVFFGAVGYFLANKKQRRFAHVGVSVVVVTLLTCLEYAWPKAVTFEFLRASVWLYVPLLAFSALTLVKLFEKDAMKKIAAVVIFCLLAFPSIAIRPSQEMAIDLYTSQTGYSTYQYPYTDPLVYHGAIIDAATYLKEHTPIDSLVMVDPRGFAHLRTYGQRSLVVTHKDANIHHKERALQWEDTYTDVQSVYATNSTTRFLEAVEKYGADYVFIDKQKNNVDLELLYENKRFAIYSV